MKATETKLLEFLKKSPQFVIPIYQRTYSWTEPECRQLWNDIIRAGNQEKVSGHFIGSIVYIEAGLYQVTSQSPLLVIDGQQRLTSVMLILEALARALGEPWRVPWVKMKNRLTDSHARKFAATSCSIRSRRGTGDTSCC